MTAPALDVDVTELVGVMPQRACECRSFLCERHRIIVCGNAAKWMVRIHAYNEATDACSDPVLLMCDDCLDVCTKASEALELPGECECGRVFGCIDDMLKAVAL
ncbi:hypothetical protein [Mycobacteroides chelonae]|uniref:hypothetical protein n=1 Tax=Mycobacteroides chelonae TaxID=1774 RepID=UPI0008AA0353|nr:hypothetical protein [Mycobacteroides chelonae]OHU48139.1 hypothetical protein BKG81_11400 [Mycobacteroides chelonae]